MYSKKLVFMCKTYHKDFVYTKRMVDSFAKFNIDNFELFLVVPRNEIDIFNDLRSRNIYVVSDEEVMSSYEPSYFGVTNSDASNIKRINAYSIRLSFWELQISENYFAIDSDMEFIRPFSTSDFFSPTGDPYSILMEYKNLESDPFYYQRYWLGRASEYKKIAEILQIDERGHKTVHNCQIMNSLVLADFKKNFLQKMRWNYSDATYFSIYEHFWYVAWLQSHKIINVIPIDELVKMIHHQGEHIYLHKMGVDKSNLSRAYLGVIVNSNWSRQYGLVDFDKPLTNLYETQGDWAKWNMSTNN